MRGLRAIAALALAGCNCGGTPPKCAEPESCTIVAMGEDAGPLESCVNGAWRNYGDGGACAPIPCRADAGPPECGRPDCVKFGFSVYLPEQPAGNSGTVFQGSFIISPSGATWSSVIPPERYPYLAQTGRLFTDGGSGPRSIDATCTAQQLVIGAGALKIRVSMAEAAALQNLVRDGGVWIGRPYP